MMETNRIVIGYNLKVKAVVFLKYAVLVIFGITTIYPLLWTLINSLKDNYNIFSRPFSLPSVYRIQNYIDVWRGSNLSRNFINSFFVSTVSVSFTLIISSIAAFAITRINFRLNFFIYSFFLLGMMVPAASVMLPTFLLFNRMGLNNNLFALAIAYTASSISITIFILTGFMKTIPKELDESAVIDGCSGFRVFWSIIFPLSRSASITATILNFLNAWNEYLLALVLISRTELKTLTLGLAGFKTEHITYYGHMSAGIIISIVPVIIVYILLQEQVIKGMTMGAVKG